MRLIAPSQCEGVNRISTALWQSTDDESGLIFEIGRQDEKFLGFFLIAKSGILLPEITIDQGYGFDKIKKLSLKAFPIAFYHIAIAQTDHIKRVRLQPATAASTYRLFSIQTNNGLLIALLHYFFNLRYQKIGIVAPGHHGRRGLVQSVVVTTQRIFKFFRDVTSGSGVHVQLDHGNMLPELKEFLSHEASPLQISLETVFAQRAGPPLISFISPTFNTKAVYLSDLIDSFTNEHAAYAELILSDDGSSDLDALNRLKEVRAGANVRVLFNTQNRGIAAATNAGLREARGDWVAFIDHDDLFVPGAIAVIANAILNHPDADFFYTDEILANAALRPIGAFCKPAFDSVLLSGMNYINHFSIFRRSRLEGAGGLRTDREGSQDYDLLLRYLANSKPGSIIHIPYLAYIWRRDDKSYSAVHSAQAVISARLALASVHASAGRPVDVLPALDANLHRVRMRGRERPLVSVIIPNKDSMPLISRILSDLQTRTDYPAMDIVVVDNGSTSADVLALYGRLGGTVTAEIKAAPFNFAAMCNRGARIGKGDAFLFLNNDIEVQDAGWLDEMVSCLAFKDTGVVGAKLLYPDGTTQHNGVIVGLGEAAGHWYIGEPAGEPGPMGRFNVRQTLTAVTGACMLVTRRCFEAAGGFDEVAFPIAYNDIDFCLRARALGFRTVWTPFAQLIHHESATRGSDETGINNERFKQEFERLQKRHGTQNYLDDAYSPFFDKRYSKPNIMIPNSLPALRPNTFA